MNRWLLACAVLGFVSVAGGAFGAHAIADHISAQRMETFETGTQYAQFHTAALLAIVLGGKAEHMALTCWCFSIGILIFTGTLWTLAITGIGWLGAITPIGGLAFLTGWSAVAWRAMRPSS